MAKEMIKVNIEPKEVLNILNKKLLAGKVDSSIYEVDGGKYVVNVVYEKTFLRSGDIALIVIADNMEGDFTKVKFVTAGTGVDIGVNIGPASKFRKKAIQVLKEYIIF